MPTDPWWGIILHRDGTFMEREEVQRIYGYSWDFVEDDFKSSEGWEIIANTDRYLIAILKDRPEAPNLIWLIHKGSPQ